MHFVSRNKPFFLYEKKNHGKKEKVTDGEMQNLYEKFVSNPHIHTTNINHHRHKDSLRSWY